jgi:U3 small nucleolar RNA-associated protein 14
MVGFVGFNLPELCRWQECVTEFTLEDDGHMGQELDGVFDVSLEGWREWNGKAIEAMRQHQPANFHRTVPTAMNNGEERDVGAKLKHRRRG